MTQVLVTGGAGFIGSNFVLYALETHPDWQITTLDRLTYAGRLENLRAVAQDARHRFVHGDVADAAVAAPLVRAADIVIHFAAETHVDRSIQSAGEFIRTDVQGTFVLLDAARDAPRLQRFVQISTDEVYGSVEHSTSRETDELRPRNPYSASKAGADRLAYSYWATYGVPASLIQPVADRPGHDRRYCLDTTKLRGLGWTPRHDFDAGLRQTIAWYQEHEWWWRPIKDGNTAFAAYYARQYTNRA